MISFNEYCRYAEDYDRVIAESSFSRLLRHIQSEDKVLLFISAETANGSKTNELKQLLKTLSLSDGADGRLSFHTIKGKYVDKSGVSKTETSFAVIGSSKALPKLEKMGRELAKKFDQDSYMIVTGGIGTIVYLKDSVDDNGRPIKAGTRRKMQKVSVDAIADYQSKFKGHSFSFNTLSEAEGYDRKTPVWMNWGAQSYNNAFMKHDNFFQWLEEQDAKRQRTCC